MQPVASPTAMASRFHQVSCQIMVFPLLYLKSVGIQLEIQRMRFLTHTPPARDVPIRQVISAFLLSHSSLLHIWRGKQLTSLGAGHASQVIPTKLFLTV